MSTVDQWRSAAEGDLPWWDPAADPDLVPTARDAQGPAVDATIEPTAGGAYGPAVAPAPRPSWRARRRARRQAFEDSFTGIDGLFGVGTSEPFPRAERWRWRLGAVAAGLVAIGASSGLVVTLLAPVVAATAITVREANDYWAALPAELPEQPLPTRSYMLAADGTRIAQFYAENRLTVTYQALPEHLKDAVVAIEDTRFYDHNGVDYRGIARAFAKNLLTDETQGGSTLTQQYVKNALLNAATDDETRREVTSRTSYLRKLREARLALAVEEDMTKEEILLGYLNISYFGDGAYGIGTAARRYFGKTVPELTLAESALLAGVVQNPTAYDPTNDKAAARDRRNVVLARMRDVGFISQPQYERASRSPVRLDLTEAPNGCVSSRYPFFCQWVKTTLESDPALGDTPAQRNEVLFRGGLTIHTTLDPAKQAVAQQAVDRALGRENRVASVAVTVEPGTGHVVAMAQNRTFGSGKPGEFAKTEIVLATQPAMQPGSTFKPITLAAALERGFDPSTIISAPFAYTPLGQAAPPGGFTNYSTSSGGDLNAYQAIARSSNTWFIRLQEQVGVLNVVSMAERLGITSIPRTGERAITSRDASLTLGAYEVAPVQMAGAFATFAAGGVNCRPVPIARIVGRDGTDLAAPDPGCHQAIAKSVADTVAATMVGTITGPDPLRTGRAQAIGRPAAGKTGTTTNTAAVWFSGFTPQYATSVWVGDPRGGFAYPLRGFTAYGSYVAQATGGSVAGPIWQEVMSGIHRGLPVKQFAPPTRTGVVTAAVVPDVRGMSIDEAYRALVAAGYRVDLAKRTARKDPALPADTVASTTPAAGSFLGARGRVTVVMTARSSLDVALP